MIYLYWQQPSCLGPSPTGPSILALTTGLVSHNDHLLRGGVLSLRLTRVDHRGFLQAVRVELRSKVSASVSQL